MTYLTWQNDLYPHIRKVFDIRLSKNLDILNQFCDVRTDYKNFPNAVYHEGVAKRTVTFKKARTTYGETSKKIGTFLADAIVKDMYKDFYGLFTRAFFYNGADGEIFASRNHKATNNRKDKFSNLMSRKLSVGAINAAQTMNTSVSFDTLFISPELEETAKKICGEDADIGKGGSNPIYGMRYLLAGKKGEGLSGEQWAIASSENLHRAFKLVYVTKPTILISPTDNPLVADYLAYVDFGFDFGEASPIIFSKP